MKNVVSAWWDHTGEGGGGVGGLEVYPALQFQTEDPPQTFSARFICCSAPSPARSATNAYIRRNMSGKFGILREDRYLCKLLLAATPPGFVWLFIRFADGISIFRVCLGMIVLLPHYEDCGYCVCCGLIILELAIFSCGL